MQTVTYTQMYMIVHVTCPLYYGSLLFDTRFGIQ